MRGTISKRGTSWRVRVEAGQDPVTGKRRYVTATLPTKAEAEDRLNAIIGELRSGVLVGHDATLGQTIDAWMAMVQLAPSARSDYRSAIKVHVPDWLKTMPVWKVRTHDLDRLYADLAAAGLGPDRIRRVHNILSSAMKQAVRWQWIARNPAVDASPPPIRRRTPKAPAADQVRTLLAAADGQLATYLRLSAHLGARRGEVCALQWTDLDLEGGQVTIRRAWSDGGKGVGLVLGPTKTDRVRTIALGPAIVADLRAWRAQAASSALAAGGPLGPWVFAADLLHHVAVRPDRMTKLFADLRDSTGLTGVQMKQLRHFVATQLLAAGEDPKTVSGRLGHARTSTTLDVYAAFVPARDRDAATLLDRLLG